MITWLLAAWAQAADILVPADLDPLGWARAWSQVVIAMQDPSLDDTRIAWTRGEGRWVLTLEHAHRRATVDGLVPATDDESRVEQLYVALGLVGRMAPANARSALRARLVPPEPPEASERASTPVPTAPAVPTARIVPEPEHPVERPRSPQPEGPSAPPPEERPMDVVHISVVDLLPPKPEAAFTPLTVMVSLDSQGGGALRVQGEIEFGTIALGGRGGYRFDPRMQFRRQVLGPRLRLHGVEVRALAELRLRGVVAGLSGGGDLRSIRSPDASLGRGLVPIVGAHVGVLFTRRLGLRAEIGYDHDLRAMGIQTVSAPAVLPAGRVGLTIGLRPRWSS